ncbi:amidase [Novosphingobium sp. G106]|uniref:amidase n=1 Tax=Novosphingobium sp. G106 TaxID=2849500 RepID=UPI001C2D9FC3|nr:amidase [Novosphingobium sp. G106]MBV1688461.1 amidase [Novosphingobium sp. G106]
MEIHYESLLSVSDRIRRGEVSSAAVTAELLSRIDGYDPILHSTLMVLADEAMEQARQADAEIAGGHWRGALHGIPIGIKDLLWTKGLPTTGGMELLRDFRPEEDATVVARLKHAGAVIIAKLHMTEGATFNHHPVFARPVNPWSAEHWTGVSSSGSGVAVAAGFCFGAIGSDTGGSIRMPSAANNLTGIKPTWGRVSRHGLIHIAESLDHLGPMARSAADAAAILQAIAGWDPKDTTTLREPVPDYLAQMDGGVNGLTLGIDWNFAARGMAPEIVASLEHARTTLERWGMKVREVTFPWNDDEMADSRTLFGAELALAHEAYFPAQADRYGAWLRGTLEAVAQVRGVDVARGHMLRERYRGRLRALFGELDVLLIPGLGKPLPTWEAMEPMAQGRAPMDMDLMRFTTPFNLSGSPTISLPAGFGPSGLPLGIQLAGPWLAEATLIRAGVAFQEATEFHLRHPLLNAA